MPLYEEDLGNSLVLRSVRSERDIERYVTFQFDMFHNAECVTVDRLLRHHPEITYDDFLFVEDEATGEIVSTTCLVPWHCRYEEVDLDLAQLELVATHPDYRRRGLIRAQIRRFHHVLQQRSFHLSAIGGIPYYYRQFGYAYAVDLPAARVIPSRAIPDARATDSGYRLRRAVPDDAPALVRLYEHTVRPLQFHDTRSLELWSYLLQWAAYPVQMVEDQSGNVVGYVCVVQLPDDRGVEVTESAIGSYAVGMAVLGLLKGKTSGDIVIGGQEQGVLSDIAAVRGYASRGGYQWLLRITDVAAFLDRLRPVLERRLSDSPFAGLTTDLRLNLFREAFELRFRNGELRSVHTLGFTDTSHGSDGGDILIPPEAFVRLVLGYRSVEQLRDAWPDIVIKPDIYPLVAALFPRMNSSLRLPYSYQGPVPNRASDALSVRR